MTRPIGLPFLGSKKRVQKDIFTLYQYLNPNWRTTPFIDLFAGGGAIGLFLNVSILHQSMRLVNLR